MLKINMIKHFKKCIRYKENLIRYYEKRNNDGAVELLEKEIVNMTTKLLAAGGKL